MKSNSKKISKSDLVSIKWIYSICKNQVGKIILLVVLNAANAAISVFFANFSKHIIDAATVHHNLNLVVKYSLYLLVIVVSQLSLNIACNSLAEYCKGKIEMILKKHMLCAVMSKEYSKIQLYHTGEIQNRMFNDVTVVSDGFTKIIPNIAFLFTKLISALIYLIVIDKVFALIFFIGGCFIFMFSQVFRKTLKKLHKRVQETEGKTRSFIQEAILNLLVVKAFVVEDKIEERTDKLQEDNFKAKMRRRNFGIIANSGISSVFNIGTVFAVAFGAWRLLNGAMTYGTVTAMLQLVNQVQSPFVSLSNIMPSYFSLIASAERLMEIDLIENEEESNEADIDVEQIYKSLSAISFDNISFRYDRDIILDNTSLSIKKGDFVAIMGISGIGKSTLLKLLLGVFNVQKGNITLKLSDGEIPIDRHTRRLFSYVPQGNMLVSGTIKDNLTFINDNVTQEEIDEAIRVSCSKQFIDELPLGIETVIGEKGQGLSEGQLQRLAIARSLLSKSPVLLLDEATSALDEATEKQFLTNLRELDNVTCIIVSHKKAALEICNKRIQIVGGKIISEG